MNYLKQKKPRFSFRFPNAKVHTYFFMAKFFFIFLLYSKKMCYFCNPFIKL